jgi:hypothetical protein
MTLNIEKGLSCSDTYLISIIKTRTDKFSHAAIYHNKIFCSISFNPSDPIHQAASICNERSPRFNDEIEISWEN